MDWATILRITLEVFKDRSLLFLTLLLNFGLFAYAMAYPNDQRLWLAAGFSLLVFLPVLLKGTKNG
jgi:hypothetical protein